ncbi:hypothetical protein AMI01nite_54890 [Aneurinibacillus migulanus]|nr:hypothetical protein AMI01nite_54890 [Aneurinibacillus migulanus]
MEKKLVKTGIYGFLISIGIMIFFTPYEIVTRESGITTRVEIPTKATLLLYCRTQCLLLFLFLY